MSNDVPYDPITEQTCKALTNTIQRKYGNNKKFSKTQSVASHACFMLTAIQRKRRSLENALSALELLTQDICKNLTQLALRRALMHWFLQYLRLRDGLVILVSGECRHPGDRKFARKQPAHHRSNLSKKSQRRDGTRVYRKDAIYSGFGWDEFYDDEVGIRKRLCSVLSSTSRVDKVMEGSSFEMVLSGHESKVTNDTAKLEQLRQSLITNVNLFLKKSGKGGTLVVKSADKFEKLEIKRDGQRVFEVDRLADNFVIADQAGVLPSNMDMDGWRCIMSLPDDAKVGTVPEEQKSVLAIGDSSSSSIISISTKSSKAAAKRKRIMESDSDSDRGDDAKSVLSRQSTRPKKTTTGGLRVKAKAAVTKSSSSLDQKTVSVIAIKEKLGVNNQTLQASLDNLEMEGGGVANGAQRVDQEITELEEDIAHCKEELSRYKKDLKSATHEDDLWNTKEGIRGVSMRLGNMLLSLSSLYRSNAKSNSPQVINALKDASNYFSYARNAVDGLIKSHELAEVDGMDDPIGKRLLLLRGRALLNMGISNVELADFKCAAVNIIVDSDPLYGELLETTIELLQETEKLALESLVDDMPTILKKLSSKSSCYSEISDMIGISQSIHLKYSACRYRGHALWRLGNRSEATITLDGIIHSDGKKSISAILSLLMTHSTLLMDELHTEILGCLVEKYSAAVLLANLAASSARIVGKANNEKDNAITLACRAYGSATKRSTDILEMIRSHASFDSIDDEAAVSIFMKDNEVTSSDSLVIAGRELKASWEKKKTLLSRAIMQTCTDEGSVSSFDLKLPTMPTNMITVNSRGRNVRERKSGKGEKTGKQSSSIPSIFREQKETSRANSKVSIVYRKWGDEMLPNGLVYPAIAPPMPTFSQST